jgi:PadR family transcriptional regulator, regulatory protein PadR
MWLTQLRKGLVEFAVLVLLRGREAYGYQLLELLAQSQALQVTESTLYPVLARLAREGALSVRVEASSKGPPRRYYRLTANGRRQLADMQRQWAAMSDSVQSLLQGEGRDGDAHNGGAARTADAG